MSEQIFPDHSLVQRIGDRISKEIGIRTGYGLLDWATHGPEPNVYWVVGGDVSHGKSAWAQNVAFNLMEQGEPVTYISSEMRQELFYTRLTTIATGINPSIRPPNEFDKAIFLSRLEEIRTSSIEFHYETRYFEIKRIIQRRFSKVYFIDYLQEIRAGDDMRDRRELISTITRNLEGLSKEQEVCIIALSQFARPEKGVIPGIHSYKESGEIEASCDIGIILDNAYQRALGSMDQKKAEQLVAEGHDKHLTVNIVKNRIHGHTTLFDLHFDKSKLKISDIAQGG